MASTAESTSTSPLSPILRSSFSSPSSSFPSTPGLKHAQERSSDSSTLWNPRLASNDATGVCYAFPGERRPSLFCLFLVTDVVLLQGFLRIVVKRLPNRQRAIHGFLTSLPTSVRRRFQAFNSVALLGAPSSKCRPPSALMEASNDYLVLQATVREELPACIQLFEKGLGRGRGR